MAINQFTVSLLPREWVENNSFNISSLYSKDEKIFDDEDAWQNFHTNLDVKKLMSKVFKAQDSYSEDTFIGEASEDNDVHIWFDKDRIEGIKFRINVYNVKKDFILQLINITKQLDCYFFYPELKLVTEPTIDELRNAIKESVAFRFAKDPIKFLNSLS